MFKPVNLRYLLAVIFVSFSTYASDLGYIVKLKPNALVKATKEFLELGNVKELNLSFGDYLEFKPKKNAIINNLAIDLIRNHPLVDYIEPNYRCISDELTTQNDRFLFLDHGGPIPPVPSYIHDPEFIVQWYLRNTGHRTWVKNSPPGVDLNILKAWKETKGSDEIIIAVVDSGANYLHKDLIQNVWVNESEKDGLPGVDDDGNGFIDDIHGYDFHNNDGDPMDGLGHGTHVAGIIGASHNKIGIRGVMGKVKIMNLKFLSDKGPGNSKNAAKAIDYAINHGARIINNSWTSKGKSKLLFEALKRAEEKGVIITTSAGNVKMDNDKNQIYPSNFDLDNIIVVGALNALDKKASFSNYGKTTVDIFAPGIKIISTDIKKEYYRRTGTSMSTPMVSAALGLLLSKYPNMSYKEAKTRLMDTSIKNENYLKHARSGRADAYRLLMGITSQE